MCTLPFSGPIPPELGKLGALQELVLWNNELSGEYPVSSSFSIIGFHKIYPAHACAGHML